MAVVNNAKCDPLAILREEMKDIKPSMSYSGGDVGEWQNSLKEKVVGLLGLDRMPEERCDLNTRSLWTQESEYGTIEKVVFSSEDGYDVPAYVCIPHDMKPPYKFFICLQGHSTGMHNSIAVDFDDESKSIEIAGDRDFAIGCMKRGIASICIEQRGFGACKPNPEAHTDCTVTALTSLMIGKTLLGERVYDIDRAIDYLDSRGDVDMDSIGVMGNSGGGTAAMFAGALLDRISYVMPSSSFCTFQDSIMSIEHCICNYIPNLMLHAEAYDIAALCAPKPLVLVNGCDDSIFPVVGAKEAFKKVQEVYRALGADDNCIHVIGDGGHRFYADDAWPAMIPFID